MRPFRSGLSVFAAICVLSATTGIGFAQGFDNSGDDLVIRAPDIGHGNARPMPEDDYIWHVFGLRPGDTLRMRSGAGPAFRIIAELEEGTPVDNLGCMDQNGGFWCRVATVGRPRISGWVNGRYLSDEGGGPLRDREQVYVPGTRYHETGPLTCRFMGDNRIAGCNFGITRNGTSAQIDITGPDGNTRSLEYRAGRFTSPDGTPVRSRKQGGDAEVTVDDETYYIPDDVMMDW